jgi:hypothetical protein
VGCDRHCDCCQPIGGPWSGAEKCPECGKDHQVFRAGSWDWEPKKCGECRGKKTKAEIDEYYATYPEELEKLKKSVQYFVSNIGRRSG